MYASGHVFMMTILNHGAARAHDLLGSLSAEGRVPSADYPARWGTAFLSGPLGDLLYTLFDE